MARKPGAFAVILDGSRRVLLCHRTDRDAWNLPGGGVEATESPWDAVVREVLEEVKLHVRVERLLGVYFMPSDHSTAYTFSCTCDDASPQPSDEADDVQWFELSALPSNTLPRHIERIRDAFSPQAGTVLRVQA